MKMSEMTKEFKEEMLGREKHHLERYVGEGAQPEQLFEAYAKIKTLEDWSREFSSIANKFEDAGDAIEDPMVKAHNYLSASLYHHIGGLALYEDTEEKKQGYYAGLRAYQKAAKYFWAPAERVEIPFRSTTLKGFFRKAPETNRTPCVISIHGADASGLVEGHYMTNFFLHKGISTLEFDLPGQYEARFEGLYMEPSEFEKAISAGVDYLETVSDVEANKIGLIGSSFGGYIAARTAAVEKRLKACISVGGFYGLDEFTYMPGAVLHLQNDMNVTPAQWPEETKKYTLDGIIDKMTCSLLVVNGTADATSPNSQVVKLYDNARCPKDIKLYEGVGHSAWYWKKDALLYIADWAWIKLQSKVLGS
ncbi:alpha/beta hydrolase family protein [Chloroflexota bacterium]